MSESYVDLAYRGLPLARHAKLTAVRPREAYVETAAPMPVGTALVLSTEDGVAIEARVIGVTEQTGGATAAPGMQIAPVLEGAASAWWSAHVALPDAPPPAKRMVIQPTAPVTAISALPLAIKPTTAPMPAVAPQGPPDAMDAGTIPMPIIDSPPDEVDDQQSKRTRVMEAVVADELLAQVAADANPHASAAIEDDGKMTQVMEAVDLSALGLEPNASGSLRMTTASDVLDGDDGDDKSKPTAAGKKKRKRR